MDSDTFKKTQPKVRPCLKRSTSVTDFGSVHFDITNLRDAKSYTLAMAFNENVHINSAEQSELLYKNSSYYDYKIETKDLITNEVITLPKEILNWQGNIHTLGDISYKWKKDCRMWLWKNPIECKKNRSIFEQNKNFS